MRAFLTCWLVLAVHWAPFMIREEFPAISLATAGTLNVARFVGWSDDVFQRPDGRAFINNNPGASILGAIPLLIARPALDAVERWNDTLPASIQRSRHAADFPASPAVKHRREWWFFLVGFLTAAGLMAPVTAAVAVYFARELRASGLPEREAIVAAALFVFATPVFFRTSYLNHNLLVSHAGLVGALLLWNRGARSRAAWQTTAAGALGGLAVLFDYSGLPVLAFLGLYAVATVDANSWLSAPRLRAGLQFASGALPPLLALAGYQWWAFGHSALPSQQYMPAIEQTARGYRGLDWPSTRVAWMNFFDARFGLFAVCPMLALAFAAPWVRGRHPSMPIRETGFVLAFFAAFTTFCAANQYSELQWTTGIRYLVPVIPGLVLLALQTARAMPRAAQVGVAAFSLVWAWIPAVTHNPPSQALVAPSEFQLAWLRRAADYGAIAHPAVLTAVVLAGCAATIAAAWRRNGAWTGGRPHRRRDCPR